MGSTHLWLLLPYTLITPDLLSVAMAALDPSDTINAGENVFIKMPSDNVKCIVLKPGR